MQYLTRDRETRWAELSLGRGEYDGAPAVLGTAVDITQRKTAEQALRRSERLASIGTLAAGLAHEINNPLGAMLLAADSGLAMLDPSLSASRLGENLRQIKGDVQRCGRIIKNVLLFARQESLEKSCHDVVEIARHACDQCRQRADTHDIRLEIESADSVPQPPINPVEIEQVLVNLLNNAIDASTAGQTVSLSIEEGDNCLQISVRDEGRGIEPDSQARVFDPFFTTRQHEGGTGLGLSLSHGIVSEHGGTIDVVSVPGKGTTMLVRLPLAIQMA